MEPKSLLLSKTLWANLVGAPLFAWLVRHGVEVDPATQDQIILGVISAMNVGLRLVTSRGLKLPGSGSGSGSGAALLALGLAAATLMACSAQQLATFGRVAAAAPPALEAACDAASVASQVALASLRGGALGTASEVASYVTAGCQEAQGLAKLAADPASADWVAGLTAMLEGLAAVAEANP